MSMFTGRKAYLPLEENRPYQVILTGWTERPNENPTETNSNIQGFVGFKWQVVEDGRVITDSRIFPLGTDILASQLIQQLQLENAMEQEDLFQMCMDSKTPVNMWVERKVKDDENFTNYHFRETKAKPVNPTSTTPTPSSVEAFH